jgi:hypothetical protein
MLHCVVYRQNVSPDLVGCRPEFDTSGGFAFAYLVLAPEKLIRLLHIIAKANTLLTGTSLATLPHIQLVVESGRKEAIASAMRAIQVDLNLGHFDASQLFYITSLVNLYEDDEGLCEMLEDDEYIPDPEATLRAFVNVACALRRLTRPACLNPWSFLLPQILEESKGYCYSKMAHDLRFDLGDGEIVVQNFCMPPPRAETTHTEVGRGEAGAVGAPPRDPAPDTLSEATAETEMLHCIVYRQNVLQDYFGSDANEDLGKVRLIAYDGLGQAVMCAGGSFTFAYVVLTPLKLHRLRRIIAMANSLQRRTRFGLLDPIQLVVETSREKTIASTMRAIQVNLGLGSFDAPQMFYLAGHIKGNKDNLAEALDDNGGYDPDLEACVRAFVKVATALRSETKFPAFDPARFFIPEIVGEAKEGDCHDLANALHRELSDGGVVSHLYGFERVGLYDVQLARPGLEWE